MSIQDNHRKGNKDEIGAELKTCDVPPATDHVPPCSNNFKSLFPTSNVQKRIEFLPPQARAQSAPGLAVEQSLEKGEQEGRVPASDLVGVAGVGRTGPEIKMAKRVALYSLGSCLAVVVGWCGCRTRSFTTQGRGNAQLALDWLGFVSQARKVNEFDSHGFLLFEFPGYGSSTGKLSQSTVHLSLAQAILAINVNKVNILAHSLGCAVGLNFASQHPQTVHGLVLVSPFASIPSMALDIFRIWNKELVVATGDGPIDQT
ncbi:hypothetical protein BASA81_006206 [Batrachochytrium salamandrivorans]|nr:hypothetical protein BASA81_006206 [Batrachochytrium salamandrivorans]